MFPITIDLSRGQSCRRVSWLVWGCLALAGLLSAPASAQAQATVYVLSHGAGTANGVPQYLTVVNGVTNQKGTRIVLGMASGLTASMALAPDGQRIYVANDRDETVSVVSTATNTVTHTLPRTLFHAPGVLQAPVQYVAVSPDSQLLYVVSAGMLSVTDTTSMTRVNFRGGEVFSQPVVSPDGTRLYARVYRGQGGPNQVAVLDAASLATITVVDLPLPNEDRAYDISITPDGRYVHLARGRVNNLSSFAVLDTTTNTIIHDRPTPNAYAAAVATSPNGAYLYVAGREAQDQLYRFSPTTYLELGTTSGVGNSYDVAFSADSARAYVAFLSGVRVINTATHTIASTIPFFGADGSPRAVAVLGANPIGPTPSNLRATAIDGNRVSLAWNQPASGPALGYVIEGGPTPGSVLGSLPTGSPATNFTFDAPTGVFYIRVHAITSSGRSAASNEIEIFVNVPRAPSAPTGLLGVTNGTNLGLSWKAGDTGGAATSFLLDVSGPVSLSMDVGAAETFSYAGVPDGTYTFRVRGVNATGTSAASNPVTLTFPNVCPGPPQTPLNVVVQRSGSLVSITWDPPSAGPAATSYVLNVAGALNLALPLDTRRAAGNVPSGTYNLSVVPVNACGSGIESVPQSITVP